MLIVVQFLMYDGALVMNSSSGKYITLKVLTSTDQT